MSGRLVARCPFCGQCVPAQLLGAACGSCASDTYRPWCEACSLWADDEVCRSCGAAGFREPEEDTTVVETDAATPGEPTAAPPAAPLPDDVVSHSVPTLAPVRRTTRPAAAAPAHAPPAPHLARKLAPLPERRASRARPWLVAALVVAGLVAAWIALGPRGRAGRLQASVRFVVDDGSAFAPPAGEAAVDAAGYDDAALLGALRPDLAGDRRRVRVLAKVAWGRAQAATVLVLAEAPGPGKARVLDVGLLEQRRGRFSATAVARAAWERPADARFEPAGIHRLGRDGLVAVRRTEPGGAAALLLLHADGEALRPVFTHPLAEPREGPRRWQVRVLREPLGGVLLEAAPQPGPGMATATRRFRWEGGKFVAE